MEISLPAQFRSQVCGLCGNYNGNATDDFAMRDTNSVAEDVAEFAHSWLVNRKSSEDKCAISTASLLSTKPRPRNTRHVPCLGHSIKKGVRVLRDCRIFKGNTMRSCRRLVDPEPYYG